MTDTDSANIGDCEGDREVYNANLRAENEITVLKNHVTTFNKTVDDCTLELSKNSAMVTRSLIRAALADLDPETQKMVDENARALVDFMSDLVNTDPRDVTNTEVKAGLVALAEINAARAILRSSQDLLQELTRIITGIVVKVIV